MFVTGESVLAYCGVKTPSPYEQEWADLVASAVNDGVAGRLNGAVITSPPPEELRVAALMAAAQAYKRREAPFASTSFADEDTAVRLARDYVHSVAPIIDRYSNGPGIG